MKKQIPALLLAVIVIVLALAVNSTRRENAQLKEQILELTITPQESLLPTPNSSFASSAPIVPAEPSAETTPALAETETTSQEQENATRRRMMKNLAQMMEDNPTMNKIVEASQRGVMGALYGDMIEYLGLEADEEEYFMELLMYRQMANVDAHMKMGSGSLSEEEKQSLMDKAKLASETMKEKMEEFLNNPADFDEFTYYEDTIGERMMLSQMDQKLGEDALSEEAYNEVLSIMHGERENYDWSTDLHDNESTDMSAERFSQDNINKHIADMKTMGDQMDRRMQEILTPEQLAAWRESGTAMQALMEGQLMQANQMFGDE